MSKTYHIPVIVSIYGSQDINLARRYGISEADLLVLEHAKVLSAQGLYSKFLDETARESLLNEVMKPYYEKKGS